MRLQPCATPSPAVWLEVLGEVDPTNNRRSVAFNESVNSTRVVAYPIEGGGDILFGTYNFTVNISEDNSNVGIAVSYFNMQLSRTRPSPSALQPLVL